MRTRQRVDESRAGVAEARRWIRQRLPAIHRQRSGAQRTGIDQVNEIFNDPNRTVDVGDKVINIYGSNGAGDRYSVGGDFTGFLEP